MWKLQVIWYNCKHVKRRVLDKSITALLAPSRCGAMPLTAARLGVHLGVPRGSPPAENRAGWLHVHSVGYAPLEYHSLCILSTLCESQSNTCISFHYLLKGTPTELVYNCIHGKRNWCFLPAPINWHCNLTSRDIPVKSKILSKGMCHICNGFNNSAPESQWLAYINSWRES